MSAKTLKTATSGKVLTANRLRDGAVVFFTRTGSWSEFIDDAVVATEPLAAQAIEQRGLDDVARNIVTDPYQFEAEHSNGRVRALHIRERIRALGPTVRQDLGKQAEGIGAAFAA